MEHDEASVRAHADRAGKMLNAMLDDLGYVLIVSSKEGLVLWNTNLALRKEAAGLLRMMADDLEANGCPPLSDLDG